MVVAAVKFARLEAPRKPQFAMDSGARQRSRSPRRSSNQIPRATYVMYYRCQSNGCKENEIVWRSVDKESKRMVCKQCNKVVRPSCIQKNGPPVSCTLKRQGSWPRQPYLQLSFEPAYLAFGSARPCDEQRSMPLGFVSDFTRQGTATEEVRDLLLDSGFSGDWGVEAICEEAACGKKLSWAVVNIWDQFGAAEGILDRMRKEVPWFSLVSAVGQHLYDRCEKCRFYGYSCRLQVQSSDSLPPAYLKVKKSGFTDDTSTKKNLRHLFGEIVLKDVAAVKSIICGFEQDVEEYLDFSAPDSERQKQAEIVELRYLARQLAKLKKSQGFWQRVVDHQNRTKLEALLNKKASLLASDTEDGPAIYTELLPANLRAIDDDISRATQSWDAMERKYREELKDKYGTACQTLQDLNGQIAELQRRASNWGPLPEVDSTEKGELVALLEFFDDNHARKAVDDFTRVRELRDLNAIFGPQGAERVQVAFLTKEWKNSRSMLWMQEFILQKTAGTGPFRRNIQALAAQWKSWGQISQLDPEKQTWRLVFISFPHWLKKVTDCLRSLATVLSTFTILEEHPLKQVRSHEDVIANGWLEGFKIPKSTQPPAADPGIDRDENETTSSTLTRSQGVALDAMIGDEADLEHWQRHLRQFELCGLNDMPSASEFLHTFYNPTVRHSAST